MELHVAFEACTEHEGSKHNPWFAEYLLRVENRTEQTNEKGEILLLQSICMEHNIEDNELDRLIDHIY
jgi:uncharacterized protein (DUF2342 family)